MKRTPMLRTGGLSLLMLFFLFSCFSLPACGGDEDDVEYDNLDDCIATECSAEQNACDGECNALGECVVDCNEDETCITGCLETHEADLDVWEALYDCIYDHCSPYLSE